jgi:hypothetical protein
MTPRERELAQRLWERFGRMYLTVEDLQAWWEPISKAHVRERMYRKIGKEKFPMVKIGRRLRVQCQDFATWLELERTTALGTKLDSRK